MEEKEALKTAERIAEKGKVYFAEAEAEIVRVSPYIMHTEYWNEFFDHVGKGETKESYLRFSFKLKRTKAEINITIEKEIRKIRGKEELLRLIVHEMHEPEGFRVLAKWLVQDGWYDKKEMKKDRKEARKGFRKMRKESKRELKSGN